MKKSKQSIQYVSVFLLSVIFYLAFFFHDGVILTEDANSYITMETNREPIYCSFLWILRIIFGESIYLNVAAVVQCLVAALVAAAITVSFQKRFQLSRIYAGAILLIQYSITFLNRFVAQRRYSYYNSIETEGLAYSLWIFFILAIFDILYDRDKKAILKAMIWAIILVSIRKQMYFSFGVLFIAIGIALWNKRKWFQSVILSFAIVIVCFMGNKAIDCSYNYLTRGVFAPHTGDASFIFGTQIYMADKEMAAEIEDETYQQLFLEIMEQATAKQYNICFAPQSPFLMQEHYSLAYDRIKFDIVNPVIREYQDELGLVQEEREAHSSMVISEIVRDLLPYTIDNIMKLFFINVIQGLVVTVSFKKQTILYLFALVAYIVFIGLEIFLLSKKRFKTFPVSMFCLIAILGNVVITSATIYCQTRYMLYNTALFYQVGLLILHDVIQGRNDNEKKENSIVH